MKIKKYTPVDGEFFLITFDNGGLFAKAYSEEHARVIAMSCEILDSLEGVARIVEGIRLSQTLGRTQLERLNKAKSAIEKARRTHAIS